MIDASVMNSRNFSGGPGILPDTVLTEVQQAVSMVPEVGLSILGISHRSDWFESVVSETEQNIRRLLNLPENYAVLFLQGGASLQFSMIPMLLLRGSDKTAEYLRTGYWSSKAIPEAENEGSVKVVWDGETCGYKRLPTKDEVIYSPDAAYLHYASNETVEGTQFHYIPGVDGVRRVCDMSSDFLSRPFDPSHFDLIYAHAQKNLGPAGITVVILKRELLDNAPKNLPAFLDYRAHLAANSIYNTPPVFAIYVVMLVTRWLLNEIGSLENMALINQKKATALYKTIDDSAGLYQGRAALADRSLMNVVFTLASTEMESAFLARTTAEGFTGLEGHRSLGGIRASIYNAMTLTAVESLCSLMEDFASSFRR